MSTSNCAPAVTSPLRQKVGGSAAALITDAVRRQASANLQTLSGMAQEQVTERVRTMIVCLSGRSEDLRLVLFREAHDIRGVSGTFGLVALGEIADAICLYLDDLRPEQSPNIELLDNLVRALQLTLGPIDPAHLMRASAECRAAVRLMRVREGRTPELT